MTLKIACVVYFELKNIKRNKNFVKIRSSLCNGFVYFFSIEDCEGKTKFVPFFRACKISYPRYDMQENSFFRK